MKTKFYLQVSFHRIGVVEESNATVCSKIRGSKSVFTRHSVELSFLYRWKALPEQNIYKYVKIFPQHFVVVKSEEDEKYTLLSQGTGYLQKFRNK